MFEALSEIKLSLRKPFVKNELKQKIGTAIFICLSILSYGQAVVKSMLRIPDTGVTTGYTATFGEDNDYNINVPYFSVNGDGTVTDTITRLMWQQYDGGEMTIEDAKNYCDSLSLANYTNWRLPNAYEAFSILNHQFSNPALNANVFGTSLANYWWTSDKQANDTTKIWATNAGGGIGNHPKTETISAGGIKRFHVRAVRDVNNPINIPSHFTDNGNGCITDNITLLIWQKIPYSDTLTWEQALYYADTLSYGAANDWRLPNIKELQSLVDVKRINPAIDNGFFTVGNSIKYWSSTTLPNQLSKAWYLDSHFGLTTYDAKTLKHNLICVRGNTVPTSIVPIKQAAVLTVYPNPFKNYIHFYNASGKEYFELRDYLGELLYAGNNIEKQDFSSLKNGFYFLKIKGVQLSIIKLIKE